MLKYIAVCVLVMGLTLQACDVGCLKCNAKNECIFCDSSNNYYLSGVNCAVSTQTNCLVLAGNGDCAQCGSNYYLDASTKKCIAVDTTKTVANCVTYGAAQACLQCAANFYISNSQCVAVLSLVSNCKNYSADGKCSACASGFIFNATRDGCIASPAVAGCSAYTFVDCKTCATGYIANQNLYFVNYQNSSPAIYSAIIQFIAGGSTNWTPLSRCQLIQDVNCLVASAFNVCTTCKAGYFLNTDFTCRIYPNPIIEACLTYNSLTTCTGCQNGYFLETSTKCTLIAGTQLITNCNTYDNTASNVQCTLCAANYYLSANTCSSLRVDSLNMANCKTNAVSSDTCATCNDNYTVTTDGKKCLPTIANCLTYSTSSSTSTSLTCLTCKNTYYLNTVNSVTTCVAGSITGCLTYSSSSTCTACDTSAYYLSGSTCVKHVQVTNCVTYSATAFNQCASCAVGFYPFNYSSICSAINVITNCITYTDSNTCATCATGYYLLNNKCVSISGTYPNCKSAVAGTTVCQNCVDTYAKKATTDNTCALNHNYILDNCSTVGSNISFKANTAADTDSCTVCKSNTYPFNLAGLFACVNSNLFATRGLATAITGCLQYDSSATPVCQQCPNFLTISTDGATRSCTTTCDLTANTNILDNLNGSINTCTPHNAGGGNAYAIANCAVAYKTFTGGNVANQCTRWINQIPFIAPAVPPADNAASFRDLALSTVPRPSDAFFYNGFATQGIASDPATNKHTNGGGAVNDCELWIFITPNYHCIRCKWGFASTLSGAGATTCAAITNCNTSVSYSGFSSGLNQYLSCHACTNNQFVTVVLNAAADASTLVTNGLKAATPSIQCQSTGTLSATTPVAVANCLIYAYVHVDGNPTVLGAGCVACAPGYKFTPTAGVYGTCAAIANCDTTKNSMANRCTACTQVNASGAAEYKAFSDSTATQCVLVSTANCLFSVGAPSLVNVNNCRICRPGHWLNLDNICEKIVLPQCADASGSTNFYVIPTWDATLITEYYAIKYLANVNSISGCNSCASGFAGFKMLATEIQCVASPYVQANSYLTATIKYITDCDKFKNAVTPGNSPSALCSVCKNNKIPTFDGTACVASINNCLVAQNSPNTGKCYTCATNYVQINGSCTLQNIANCATYDNTFAITDLFCTVCSNGYVLATNKKTCYIGYVTGCQSYNLDNPWSCSTCLSGYSLVSTVNSRTYCFKIDSGSNCSVLDNSANGLQGGLYKCTTCSATNTAAYLPQTYSTSDNTKVQSTCLALNLVDKCISYGVSASTVAGNSFLCTACSAGYWIDLTKNVCTVRVNQPAGCVTYTAAADTCQTCSSSTFINPAATDCISFPNGILGCATYSNTTVCTSCNAPRYLSGNACPLSTVINNCVTYTANYTCSKCNSGYFLTNSTQCDVAIASNCYTYTSINACEKCDPTNPNKGLKTDTNGVTSCVDKNVANCAISTSTFPFTCTKCSNGFYLAVDGTCAAATSINNCLTYDSATTCTLCNQLSVLSVDRKSCNSTFYTADNDVNCVDSQLQSTPICSQCNPGSVFVNGVCTSCSNNTYANGCFTCNPANQTICFACRPGYYQLPNGNCVAVNGQAPTNSTSSAALFKIFSLFAVLLAFFF